MNGVRAALFFAFLGSSAALLARIPPEDEARALGQAEETDVDTDVAQILSRGKRVQSSIAARIAGKKARKEGIKSYKAEVKAKQEQKELAFKSRKEGEIAAARASKAAGAKADKERKASYAREQAQHEAAKEKAMQNRVTGEEARNKRVKAALSEEAVRDAEERKQKAEQLRTNSDNRRDARIAKKEWYDARATESMKAALKGDAKAAQIDVTAKARANEKKADAEMEQLRVRVHEDALATQRAEQHKVQKAKQDALAEVEARHKKRMEEKAQQLQEQKQKIKEKQAALREEAKLRKEMQHEGQRVDKMDATDHLQTA